MLTVALLLAAHLALAQTGDQVGTLDTVLPSPGGAVSALSVPFASSGPLIADDANTVVHLRWNGSALVPVVGPTWTMHGTVPQATSSPFYPSGFGGSAKAGGGPFTDSNYYTLPAGTLDFGSDFILCFVFTPGDISTLQVLSSNVASNVGWQIDLADPGTGQMAIYTNDGAYAGVTPANMALPNTPNLVCAGRSGSTLLAQLNEGTVATRGSAPTAASAATVYLGRHSVAGSPFLGTILEVWASTTTPTSGNLTAIARRVFSQIAPTSQTLTVARSTSESYLTPGPLLWYAPAATLGIESSGAHLDPASTNLQLYSEQFNNGAWSNDGPTVTADAIAAPDGQATADLVQATGSGSLFQHLSSSQYFVASTFVKRFDSSNTTFSLFVNCNNAGTNPTATCGATGGLSCSTACSSSACNVYGGITLPDDAWYRVWIAVDCKSSQPSYCGLNGSADGNGKKLYAWGYQCEQTTYPTAYIPTAGTAVARTADVQSVPTTGIIDTRAGQGSVTLTPEWSASQAGTNRTLWADSDSSLVYVAGSSLFRLTTGGVSVDSAAQSFAAGAALPLRWRYQIGRPSCLSVAGVETCSASPLATELVPGATLYLGSSSSAGVGGDVASWRWCRAYKGSCR